MLHLLKLLLFFFIIIFLFTGCSQKFPEPNITSEPVESPLPEPSLNAVATSHSTEFLATEPLLNTATLAPDSNDYGKCGAGVLVEVPYFFKDVSGAISPTQVVRFQTTSDEVRRYVSVISCLVYDEGWQSNSEEVENGYENVILLFDKYGKGHSYRIIIGGHYVAPYDPTHEDITGSLNGLDDQYYHVDDWINITQDYFTSTGVRQIGVDIYLEDTDGNLSRVLKQVYQFKDTNLQIEAALRSGEGYPDQVPDGFFLFATESWLITPE